MQKVYTSSNKVQSGIRKMDLLLMKGINNSIYKYFTIQIRNTFKKYKSEI